MKDVVKLANEFVKKTGIEIDIKFIKEDSANDFFENKFHNSEIMDNYLITIKRGERKFSYNFHQCIDKSGVKVLYKYSEKFTTYKTVYAKIDRVKLAERNKSLKDLSKYFIVHSSNLNYYDLITKVVLPEEPTYYEILASLEKYDPEDFDNFCAMTGYSNDSIKALKVYEAVKEMYTKLLTLFSDDEMDKLREIY